MNRRSAFMRVWRASNGPSVFARSAARSSANQSRIVAGSSSHARLLGRRRRASARSWLEPSTRASSGVAPGWSASVRKNTERSTTPA